MGTCFKCNKSCVYMDVTKDRNIKDLFWGSCDLCRNIVCRECSKVTSSDIRALMTQSRIILYFCEGCLCNIKQISDNLRDMKRDVQQLKPELKSTMDSVPKSYAQVLSKTTNTLKKEIDDIKGSAEFISQCYDDQKKELIKATDTLKKYDKETNALKQNIIIIVDARENSSISVELCSKQDRSALFKRRKEIGKITADSCGLQGGIIYFNEDLTIENQKLFKLARDARRQKTVEAAYTYNGSVYVKKTPTSPAVKILNEDSLSSELDT
ncbi:unnamed protein product [Ceutorhynchus assimilis]|uniref:Uncharacterized protein n=1 Tax=Ceutorhynchus assimilis TaxID=467358 RepID=A0A9N9QIP9_9CUCU|nr:unnamed protein product [Ceutorhynchus assimilis]